ncbi:TetR/AcrR family transcriptional regulator [Pseudoduganella umbonata]|uniref:AcrR family transcriptional regulator n=1 Tax=Pseudoduganella umbonata TaxID=864828 RepID=A0A4P8HNJ6_9BURK|nr:TetR/AcrR family transcriptional regulator [Pseudoduganella umbonata]MBB3219968.1 AcrR family transcriptional regulator [Pseudoduganella umbonata]QCP09980.1 TetR/AcrR family transcriptional regulator [Pseudoduganella umbonata]
MTGALKAAKGKAVAVAAAQPKSKAVAKVVPAAKPAARRARAAIEPAGDAVAKAATPAAKAIVKPAAKPAKAGEARLPTVVRTAAPSAKLNKRSSETIGKILAATEEIILRSGAERISIFDVCEEVGISRGTFYRYFSSQDDLLDAFSRHKRDQFHTNLQKTADLIDPDERFQALLTFIDDYLENTRARRLLLVAPDYAMRWLQRIFTDSVHRFQDLLTPVFDAWEVRRGIVIDRELVCELMVRYIMSDVLVPAGPDRRNLMRRIERFVLMLMSGRTTRR